MISTLRHIKRAGWRFLAKQMGLKYKLPSGAFVQVDSFSDWCTLGDIFINGEYDAAIEYALASYCQQRDFVFLDLGANVGFFTQRLIQKANSRNFSMSSFKGLLVEATPTLKPELEKRLSPLVQKKVNLFFVIAAVGVRTGIAHMEEGRSHSRNSTTLKPSIKSWSVPFIDLESESLTAGVVDLIKCDIEGAEKDFLDEYPALLRRCKVLVIECHPPYCSVLDARNRVESLGLEFRGVLRDEKEGETVWFANPQLIDSST